MSFNTRIKPKKYEYNDQLIANQQIKNSFHQFIFSPNVYEEISKLKQEIERKNKIISVYEIDLHKLQLQLLNKSIKQFSLKNKTNIYQNIQTQLDNLKHLINETKAFFVNEMLDLQNYYENIIFAIITKTNEIIQFEQSKIDCNVKEQTRQENKKLFQNQIILPSQINKYKKKSFNQKNDSFLVDPLKDKIDELKEVIREKEVIINQLRRALKESAMYMTSGMENVKLAMKLDDEVKQILSESKISKKF